MQSKTQHNKYVLAKSISGRDCTNRSVRIGIIFICSRVQFEVMPLRNRWMEWGNLQCSRLGAQIACLSTLGPQTFSPTPAPNFSFWDDFC
eukprot:1788596-Amphidinium_carterae.1